MTNWNWIDIEIEIEHDAFDGRPTASFAGWMTRRKTFWSFRVRMDLPKILWSFLVRPHGPAKNMAVSILFFARKRSPGQLFSKFSRKFFDVFALAQFVSMAWQNFQILAGTSAIRLVQKSFQSESILASNWWLTYGRFYFVVRPKTEPGPTFSNFSRKFFDVFALAEFVSTARQIFQILAGTSAISLVQKSSQSEPSSRFFGHLKFRRRSKKLARGPLLLNF